MGDGYALRDALCRPGVRDRLDPGPTAEFEQALAACALGSASLPDPVRGRLKDALALDRAREVLETSPFDPGLPGGNPLEHRIRTAPSSEATSF
ncbi:hypothetical protein ACFVX9_37270 [Kitasatospora sp. NPDC058243]|uniref:hypothetical protein n=1 Tax=Kitasatospora sp. NPDC058243 TaxID=3346397 RepID=UPI0036DA5DE1